MNLGTFACVAWVGHRAPHTVSRGDSAALQSYPGLFRRSPLVAVTLAFFLLCLAGLPPGFAGLFAKVVVFRSALVGNARVLALIMAVNTVIGLYYYLKVTADLFAAPAAHRASSQGEADQLARRPVPAAAYPLAAAIGLSAIATVVLGFAPQVVVRLGELAWMR